MSASDRRSTSKGMDDYRRRAEREAAAIIAEALPNTSIEDYERVLWLVAIGWLQGNIAGTHETLSAYEDTFDEMRAAL